MSQFPDKVTGFDICNPSQRYVPLTNKQLCHFFLLNGGSNSSTYKLELNLPVNHFHGPAVQFQVLLKYLHLRALPLEDVVSHL